jgi:hypothetical protein
LTIQVSKSELAGTKQRVPASYVLWWNFLYAWTIGAAISRKRRGTSSLAGGCCSMGSGDQPSRRLERRWAPRYSFRADLEIEWGSAVLRGSTRDISSNGMFIEAVDPLWIGAGFSARLNLNRPVRLECFVKRIEPGRGMGVSVALAESESQQLYQDLLSSLSSPGS